MVHAVILAIFVGIIWAFVVSRTFRILAGILVVAGVFWFMAESDKAEKQKVADRTASEASNKKLGRELINLERPRGRPLWCR